MEPSTDDYPKYQKSIYAVVGTWVRKSRFEFDELLSEAHMAFLHAVDTYDLTKASFHTHLYITVNGRLRNYVNKKQVVDEELDDFLASKEDNPEQALLFSEVLEELSREASEVVDVVLNTPGELIELVRQMTSNRQGKMHLYRSGVTRFFKDKGWGATKINRTYTEIKNTFDWS